MKEGGELALAVRRKQRRWLGDSVWEPLETGNMVGQGHLTRSIEYEEERWRRMGWRLTGRWWWVGGRRGKA